MAWRLGIECSLCGVGVGLIRIDSEGMAPEPLIAVSLAPQQNSSASALAALVDSLLTDHGLSMDMIEEAVVATGPGSFTGIRIGLAFAYGLAAAKARMRVVGVSGLGLVTAGLAARTGGEAALLLPQTQTHGFICAYPGRNAAPAGPDAGRLVAYADVLPAAGGGSARIHVVAARFHEKLQAMRPNVELLPAQTALLMSLQGMSKMARIAEDLTMPLPCYGRLSTAEEKAEPHFGNSPGNIHERP